MSKAHFTLLYLLYTRTDRFGGLKQQQIFFFTEAMIESGKKLVDHATLKMKPGQFMLHIEFQASLGIEGTQSQKRK